MIGLLQDPSIRVWILRIQPYPAIGRTDIAGFEMKHNLIAGY